MLALLCLWEEELGRRREWVAWHQHQLLKLQQLLDVLFNQERMGRSEKENKFMNLYGQMEGSVSMC